MFIVQPKFLTALILSAKRRLDFPFLLSKIPFLKVEMSQKTFFSNSRKFAMFLLEYAAITDKTTEILPFVFVIPFRSSGKGQTKYNNPTFS